MSKCQLFLLLFLFVPIKLIGKGFKYIYTAGEDRALGSFMHTRLVRSGSLDLRLGWRY